MRVFEIRKDGKFAEYVKTPFKMEHVEKILEDWISSNSDCILEDTKLLIIGRQITTNLGGFIDLLAIDRIGNLVIIELKRDRTPRETLAQALEYASFAEQLEANQIEEIYRIYQSDDSASLAEVHRKYFQLDSDEAISINKDQRIIIIGQKITAEIKQTSNYLISKGMLITCIEFDFFQTEDRNNLFIHNIVVESQPTQPQKISTGTLPAITQNTFLESLDSNGKHLISQILQHASNKSLLIHWGVKGCSINSDIDGMHVAICFCYPPTSVYKQSIYTALQGRGGLASKVEISSSSINDFAELAINTNLFTPAGRELKCSIDRQFMDDEISKIIDWIDKVDSAIRNNGLKQ